MELPPFDHLLDEHGRDVHRYLLAVAGPGDAADCYQETVVAALRAYPDLRDATNLRGWLLTIAHHKAMDGHRRRARHAVADGLVPTDRPAAAAGPEELAVAAGGDLWGVVRALPEGQRAAVVHRYVLDLPYVEIAALLGCSEAAARQRVRAGLATLRAALRPPAAGDGLAPTDGSDANREDR
ncbi:MAG: RNA polymerase sigma factor [Acidimicrobiales bacterium]